MININKNSNSKDEIILEKEGSEYVIKKTWKDVRRGVNSIKKQIELATGLLTEKVYEIPEVYTNNLLLELINSNFFDEELINDYIPFNSEKIFYLTEYKINDNSLGFNQAVLFSIITIIVSLIFSIIIVIILQFSRKF